MIGNILAALTPAYILGGAVILGIITHILVRIHYEYKVRRAGGVHAPTLASNTFTGS